MDIKNKEGRINSFFCCLSLSACLMVTFFPQISFCFATMNLNTTKLLSQGLCLLFLISPVSRECLLGLQLLWHFIDLCSDYSCCMVIQTHVLLDKMFWRLALCSGWLGGHVTVIMKNNIGSFSLDWNCWRQICRETVRK